MSAVKRLSTSTFAGRLLFTPDGGHPEFSLQKLEGRSPSLKSNHVWIIFGLLPSYWGTEDSKMLEPHDFLAELCERVVYVLAGVQIGHTEIQYPYSYGQDRWQVPSVHCLALPSYLTREPLMGVWLGVDLKPFIVDHTPMLLKSKKMCENLHNPLTQCCYLQTERTVWLSLRL